jgi:monoamine oxidase
MPAPWVGPAEWDELSGHCDWLDSLPGLSQPARQELNGAVFPYAATPCDPSLLYHLFVLRSAGGWRQLLGNRLGGQDLRLVRGAAELSTELAARLTARGVTIALSHQVLSLNISSSAGSVPITYMAAGDGAPSIVQAGAAIIAMSTPDANRVEYISASDPSDFPLQRRQLMSEVVGNPGTKAFVLFEGAEAEWQRTGAQTIPALEGLMYDYSPLDGRPGLLMTFSDAKDDIERLIWDGLVRLLVSTLPGITQEIDEIMWYGWYPGAPAGDPTRWDTTGATTVMGPGTLSRLGAAWRAPIAQQLYWAGSDTSDISSGYIEGGVRAGQRAAVEVLAHAAQREAYQLASRSTATARMTDAIIQEFMEKAIVWRWGLVRCEDLLHHHRWRWHAH